MRFIMIIGDGMGDRPIKDLKCLTPLESTELEHMDRVAMNGVTGLLDPVSPGVAAGSDVALLTILGYDPFKVYCGRGSFEAIGAGIKMEDGDVAFRCNFATVNRDMVIMDERAGRIRDEASDLAFLLEDVELKENSDVKVTFKHTLDFRGVLVLHGDSLSPKVEAPAPRIGSRPFLFKPMGGVNSVKTAHALNEFVKISYKILSNHPVNEERRSKGKPPANIIIPWGPGTPPEIKPFHEKYNLRATCIAAVSLIMGVARACGIRVIRPSGATGYIDTDVAAKARAALDALETSDLVIVHVEGPDEAGHDGDVQGKISIIKKIDSMVGMLLRHIEPESVGVMLLADHVTSTRLKMHTGDPVPVAIMAADIINDSVNHYSERAVYNGGLGRISGKHLMPILLNIIGKPDRIGG